MKGTSPMKGTSTKGIGALLVFAIGASAAANDTFLIRNVDV